MANPEEKKEVDFHYFCERCVNKDTIETMDPCNECLDVPERVGTEKPIKFEAASWAEKEIREKYGVKEKE